MIIRPVQVPEKPIFQSPGIRTTLSHPLKAMKYVSRKTTFILALSATTSGVLSKTTVLRAVSIGGKCSPLQELKTVWSEFCKGLCHWLENYVRHLKLSEAHETNTTFQDLVLPPSSTNVTDIIKINSRNGVSRPRIMDSVQHNVPITITRH